MRFIYSTAIRTYVLLIHLAALVGNSKAKLWIRGRKDQKLQQHSILPNERWIWVHASSLGEFEQGRPLIEALKIQFPDLKILLTFFSPSGYEIRKNYSSANRVLYMPADLPSNAKKFIDTYHPIAVFFVKYDFWFNFLAELKKRNIPVFLVSGIFRPAQHFFKWYGKWQRKQLNAFSHFFLQDESSQKLLQEIGLTNCSISGDTRFDRVIKLPSEQRSLPLIELFAKDSKVLMAGSSWEPDEDHIIHYMKECPLDLKFIIVPHEVDNERILALIKKLPLTSMRYSEANSAEIDGCRVLIIDTIGILGYLYRFADIVMIGNGFGSGIHNILEPAVYGKPVLFGPNYHKFREAIELVEAGGAFTFSKREEFGILCNKLLNDPDLFKQASAICADYVMANAGATASILGHASLNCLVNRN